MLSPTKSQYNQTLLPSDAASAASAANAVAAPPSNPNAAANPYDTSNLPFQGIYNEDQAAANKAYEDAITGLKQQRAGINLQYGFNDQGVEDPNNPLGAFQMQRGTEAQQLDDARNTSVSRGIGTIGLGAQAERGLHLQQDAADNNLLGTYKGLLNQNDQGMLSAASSKTAQLLAARRAQIQSAIDSGYFTPQSLPGEDAGPAPSWDEPTGPQANSTPNVSTAKLTPQQKALTQYLVDSKKAVKANPSIYVHSTGAIPMPKPAPKPATKPAPKPATKSKTTNRAS